MRAIDLYSGVGGWSLGLAIAGIDVVASYEIWDQANDTKRRNIEAGWYSGAVKNVDIRSLELDSLPESIDVVVGSPPCTQFSYSNRGGSGDIQEGLTDIEKFFEIVDHLNPTFWVMENVPRVRRLLEQHISEKNGRLRRFRHLFEYDGTFIQTVDMSNFGLPQRRKRCLAGNLPIELLMSYSGVCPDRTLGDVMEAMDAREIKDPIYGFEIDQSRWFDHTTEVSLTREEMRLNHDNKRFHPVYNDMAFPDEIDRPVRAITATCTRVSRESVVIKDSNKGGRLRRLTIRERASLQGFPVTFQFHGRSYASKLRMIGNAMPPLMAFYIGSAIRGVPIDTLKHPNEFMADPSGTFTPPPVTKTDRSGRFFPSNRSFRAAIPNLRFKSGVRFELSNLSFEGQVSWSVRFLFGTPKNILELPLDVRLLCQLREAGLLESMGSTLRSGVFDDPNTAFFVKSEKLQAVWTRMDKGMGPHDVVDYLGSLAKRMSKKIDALPVELVTRLLERLIDERTVTITLEPDSNGGRRIDKIRKNVSHVLSGMILGAIFNNSIDKNPSQRETGLNLCIGDPIDNESTICHQPSPVEEHLSA